MQTIPSRQNNLADLARFKRDAAYYEAHYQDLLARYPGQWIAIYNQAVVGTAEKFDDLLIALRQRGVPPEHALVERLSCDDDVLILPLLPS